MAPLPSRSPHGGEESKGLENPYLLWDYQNGYKTPGSQGPHNREESKWPQNPCLLGDPKCATP